MNSSQEEKNEIETSLNFLYFHIHTRIVHLIPNIILVLYWVFNTHVKNTSSLDKTKSPITYTGYKCSKLDIG